MYPRPHSNQTHKTEKKETGDLLGSKLSVYIAVDATRIYVYVLLDSKISTVVDKRALYPEPVDDVKEIFSVS